MAHYAKVNNGIVEQVIVAEADFFDHFVDTSPGQWIQTSYNTKGGIYYTPGTHHKEVDPDQSKALRGNYASIGGLYDAHNDVFYAKQPYPSWILDKTTWSWIPPIPFPMDGKAYQWNEQTKSWELF